MKLLFDENLSPRLPVMVAREFPQSVHVGQAGLRGAADHAIWVYALRNGFAVVSKNTDFRERSFVEGAPPKIIWLDVGNAGTRVITNLLRKECQRIEEFATQEESSFLILSLDPASQGGNDR